MKTSQLTVLLILTLSKLKSQTPLVVYNDKLLLQLSENEAARSISNSTQRSEHRDRKLASDRISQKLAVIITTHELLYEDLKNVQSILSSGKKVAYFANYLVKSKSELTQMISLTQERPKHAALLYKYYNELLSELILLQRLLSEELLTSRADLLLSVYEREILIEKLLERARNIYGILLYINMTLRLGENKPVLQSIPVLKDYYMLDKEIVKSLIGKYKNLLR